jgi:hypothetical protein
VRRGETHGKHDLCHAFSFGRTTIFFKKMMLHLFRVWERKKLSCVVEKMHDKHDLFRGFSFGRTSKSLFAVWFFFAVHRVKNARQRTYLPWVGYKTHGKDFDT